MFCCQTSHGSNKIQQVGAQSAFTTINQPAGDERVGDLRYLGIEGSCWDFGGPGIWSSTFLGYPGCFFFQACSLWRFWNIWNGASGGFAQKAAGWNQACGACTWGSSKLRKAEAAMACFDSKKTAGPCCGWINHWSTMNQASIIQSPLINHQSPWISISKPSFGGFRSHMATPSYHPFLGFSMK